MIALPVASVAQDSVMVWRATRAVAGAICWVKELPGAGLRPVLARMSTVWERRWNKMVAQAIEMASLTTEDREWIQTCDEAWAALVHEQLEPYGYRMQPVSMVRLL
jgi:hypothetical protein